METIINFDHQEYGDSRRQSTCSVIALLFVELVGVSGGDWGLFSALWLVGAMGQKNSRDDEIVGPPPIIIIMS